MEPRTSTRSGQIAINMPLKNAFGQRWATHKIQLSRKWRGPGSPFPKGNSNGVYIYIYRYRESPKSIYNVYMFIPWIRCVPDVHPNSKSGGQKPKRPGLALQFLGVKLD